MAKATEIKIVNEWIYLHLKEELSHTEIAKLYNVDRNTVQRNLSRRNIQSINYQNRIRHDLLCFDNIITEKDAYWLGFIYADGCVSSEGKFTLGLQYQDYWHIVKLKHYLMLDAKIEFNEKTNSFRISTRSMTLVHKLMDLGVIPNKSLILTYPTFLKDNLHKHFIRGYFDGDGCISIHKEKDKTRLRLSVSLLGTREFLNGVRDNCNIVFSNYVNNNGSEDTLVLSTAHRKGLQFITWLYEDATIYLDRKFDKFKQAIILYETK